MCPAVGPRLLLASERRCGGARVQAEETPNSIPMYRRTSSSCWRISVVAVLGQIPPIDGFSTDIHGALFAALLGMYAGPADEGEQVLQPLRELADPLAGFSERMQYVDAQQIYDADYPAGHRYYGKATNLPALPGEAVDALVGQARRAPSQHSTVDIRLNGGAISRVADDATAISARDGLYVINPEANWEDAGEDDANLARARDVLASVETHASGGA